MLTLTRKDFEAITIVLEDGRHITVQYRGPRRGGAKIGIDAPHTIKIYRAEVAPKGRKP